MSSPEIAQDIAVAPAAEAVAPQGSGFYETAKRILFQLALSYLVMSFFKTHKPIVKNEGSSSAQSSNYQLTGTRYNLFNHETVFDLFVYVNEDPLPRPGLQPFWVLRGLRYSSWTQGPNGDGSYSRSGQITLTETMKNNGSIYLHACFTRSGNPFDSGRTDRDEVYQHKAQQQLVEIISHYHPNFTINLIDDYTAWDTSKLVSPLDRIIEPVSSSNSYYPIVYMNDYWNLNSEYFELNDTLNTVNLDLVFAPMKLWKLQLYLSQEVKPSWYNSLTGGAVETGESMYDEQDFLKRSILETNMYLLAITVIVSIAHSFFEFLAFKNDIQFWRNKTDLQGLSVRSLLFNIFSSMIVMLYVFDNQSNFAIRLSAFFGFLIELWKIPKCLNIKLERRPTGSIFPYKLKVAYKESYEESSTSEYDKTAFKYLSILFFPLVVCYALYSLIYHEHRGWYSWLLSMIYGFLLTFGFIMMTPQLFINYKLKSVAHLPWRMMTYKALNTFVDDIFAFVVKTPILYRLSCLRDDVIFFIYLYQRWIYKVDFTRINEFGLVGDQLPPEASTETDTQSHEKSE